MTSTSESELVSMRAFRLDLRREDDVWICRQNFFNVEAYGYDRDMAINEVKGIVLCAIGTWTNVPDQVAFEVVERT